MRKLILFLLLAMPIKAQQLPFKPQATVIVKMTCGHDAACWQIYRVDQNYKWYIPLKVPHTTADRAWFSSTAASVLMTVADCENSRYALARPGTVEANPVARTVGCYGIGMPIAGVSSYIGWRYKREDDALRAAGFAPHKYVKWHLLNDFNMLAHCVGIAVTLAETAR